MKKYYLTAGVALMSALLFIGGLTSIGKAEAGGHDPRTYKLVAHPHLPVTIYIPVSWDSRTAKRSKDEHHWILAPGRSDKRDSRPPKIDLTIYKLDGDTEPKRMLGDGYTNAGFQFGGEGAGGRVIADTKILADVDQGNLHFAIQAEAYTDEDKYIVQEILRYIDVSAW